MDLPFEVRFDDYGDGSFTVMVYDNKEELRIKDCLKMIIDKMDELEKSRHPH